MKLNEIIERQEAIRAELKKIEDNPAAVEESDGDYVDTLIDEYDSLETRRVPLAARSEKLNLISTAVKNDDTATEAGDDRPEPFTQVYRNKRSPWDNMEAVRTGVMRETEVISRAQDAIEWTSRTQYVDFDDDKAELATRVAARGKGHAAHILRTGSQEYFEDFRDYMRDPEGMSRATTTGTGSLGYMLPFVLDPTIILSNAGSANPYRRFSRVETTTGPTWNGVTSAGVNAAMGSESAAATDASPTVAQLQITPQRARAWVFGSFESMEDSDLGSQLPKLFADAKDRLEESQFATGAGTGVFPQGVVTGGTTGATAASTAYAAADVYTLMGSLPARFRNSQNTVWVSNLFYINKTRQFDTSGGSSFWANLGQGTPEQLLGRPVYESTSLSAATATGSNVLVFMDGNQFIIVDRIGMSIRHNDMVMSAATANLPTGEEGWYAFWRYSSKVAVATAVQVMQIK